MKTPDALETLIAAVTSARKGPTFEAYLKAIRKLNIFCAAQIIPEQLKPNIA
jgi:hypothetical protein